MAAACSVPCALSAIVFPLVFGELLDANKGATGWILIFITSSVFGLCAGLLYLHCLRSTAAECGFEPPLRLESATRRAPHPLSPEASPTGPHAQRTAHAVHLFPRCAADSVHAVCGTQASIVDALRVFRRSARCWLILVLCVSQTIVADIIMAYLPVGCQ